MRGGTPRSVPVVPNVHDQDRERETHPSGASLDMSSAFSRARRFCTSASFMRPTSRRLGSRARFLDGDGDDDELREACCAGILRPVLGRPDGLIGGARSASSSLSTDERFLGVRLTNDDRDGPGAASSTSTSSSLLESAASCMRPLRRPCAGGDPTQLTWSRASRPQLRPPCSPRTPATLGPSWKLTRRTTPKIGKTSCCRAKTSASQA